MFRSRCLLQRPLVDTSDTCHAWHQIKGERLGHNNPQFAFFVNSWGGKCFLLGKCRKQCYQWDVTTRDKCWSSEVIMRPRFKITHLCFSHVSQTYQWNSFNVYVIQVRLHHLPHNPKDKELNTALGHVWTIKSKWICILITLDIVWWTKTNDFCKICESSCELKCSVFQLQKFDSRAMPTE